MAVHFLLSKSTAFNNAGIVIASYLLPRGTVYLLLLQGIKKQPWHVTIMIWNRILPGVHCLNIIKSKIQRTAYTYLRVSCTYLMARWKSTTAIPNTLDHLFFPKNFMLQHSAAQRQPLPCHIQAVFKGSQIWKLAMLLFKSLSDGNSGH